MALYSDNLIDERNGLPIEGANLWVYDNLGVEATLTDALDQPLTQPLVTDADGGFEYKADDGLYRHDFWKNSVMIFRDNRVIVGTPATVSASLGAFGISLIANATASDARGDLGLSAPSGAGLIGISPSGDVQDAIGYVTPAMFGATGLIVDNGYAPINTALTNYNDVIFADGTYKIGTQKLGEYQKPLNIEGGSSQTIIVPDNVDNIGFRHGAVGGSFGEVRAYTRHAGKTYKAPASAVAPYSITAISASATFPIAVENEIFIDLGPDALKLTANYYGHISGCHFVGSGIYLNDVNTISFHDCEVRANEFDDPSKGADNFGDVTKYPITHIESDGIKWFGGVIEGWQCPVILLQRAYNTSFNGTWFEGNDSTTHVIKWEQAQTLEFNSCQLDFAVPFVQAFISINMATPTADESVDWVPCVRVNGGNMLLTSATFGDCGKFVSVTASEKVIVQINGTTLRGGVLYADRTVEFDVNSVMLNGGIRHCFYSRPNAKFQRHLNSWVPLSVSADWDFATANFTGATLTVTTTTTDREFLTGTKAVKITGFTNGTTKTFSRTTTTEMPAITTGTGQTYLVFIRLMFDKDVTLSPNINGGFADFLGVPAVSIPLAANRWYDVVYKTGIDSTQAQGRFNPPELKYSVTNASGADAIGYIDRIDYQICDGDHYIGGS